MSASRWPQGFLCREARHRILRLLVRPYSLQAQNNTQSDLRKKRHCRNSPDKPSNNRGRPRNTISTLNPALISPSDYLDLSRRVSVNAHFSESRSPTSSMIYYDYFPGDLKRRKKPFPSQCAGFFYYHRPPDAAPLEGSIRLRVAWSNSASAFPNGEDLLLPSGSPWQIILPQIASHAQYAGIREQLLHENLVTEKQLSRCRAVFGNKHRTGSHRIIFRFNQEFPVQFDSGIYLTIVDDALYDLEFDRIFHAVLGKDRERLAPWTGTALARFEPSAHSGRRVVHLRIVKIVTPVSCPYSNRVSKPMGGQLLTLSRYNNEPEPWAYDIDDKDTAAAVALRVLWNMSGLPSSTGRGSPNPSLAIDTGSRGREDDNDQETI
ncbi:hypothetical protein B0H19DRAFT_1080631 [Mycena capillaripes]|nr:hypothetical protein B0H19DRAFT_1080631 [Mycena capillaripes]